MFKTERKLKELLRSMKHKKVLTVLAEDGSSVEVVQDGAILLKWTLHLLPCHELPNLSSQLYKFLKMENHIRPVP